MTDVEVNAVISGREGEAVGTEKKQRRRKVIQRRKPTLMYQAHVTQVDKELHTA